MISDRSPPPAPSPRNEVFQHTLPAGSVVRFVWK